MNSVFCPFCEWNNPDCLNYTDRKMLINHIYEIHDALTQKQIISKLVDFCEIAWRTNIDGTPRKLPEPMTVHTDQVIMCCMCGKDLALTIFDGNSLCNGCYQEVKRIKAQQQRERLKTFDVK